MDRTEENNMVISKLIQKVRAVDEVGERVSLYIERVWRKKRFLPVLITDTTGDLNQAFLYGLNDALKRNGLGSLVPDTYYSIALDRMDDWECNYPSTYAAFEQEISKKGISLSGLRADLKIVFKEVIGYF